MRSVSCRLWASSHRATPSRGGGMRCCMSRRQSWALMTSQAAGCRAVLLVGRCPQPQPQIIWVMITL